MVLVVVLRPICLSGFVSPLENGTLFCHRNGRLSSERRCRRQLRTRVLQPENRYRRPIEYTFHERDKRNHHHSSTFVFSTPGRLQWKLPWRSPTRSVHPYRKWRRWSSRFDWRLGRRLHPIESCSGRSSIRSESPNLFMLSVTSTFFLCVGSVVFGRHYTESSHVG